jgi:arsenate reductase
MAEAWLQHLKGDIVESYSAGIETHGLNQRAVKVMAEAGIDISKHQSKNVRELINVNFDYIITVCDHANETCPVFPGKVKRFHISFDDPPRLTKEMESEENILDVYRRVRDEIRIFVEKIPDILSPEAFIERSDYGTKQR